MGNSQSSSTCGKSGCKPFIVSQGPCSSTTSAYFAFVNHSLKVGDLVRVLRKKGIWHWVVYIGDNMAIHLTPNNGEEFCQCPDDVKFHISNKLPTCTKCGKCYEVAVRCDAIDTALGNGCCMVDNSLDKKCSPLPSDTIVKSAKSLLGPVKYSLTNNNCEHFAKFCRYRKANSGQSLFEWPNYETYLMAIKNTRNFLTEYSRRFNSQSM
ncbi:hypothetical protein BsWGS_08494 [Bradybaena similaris]